MRRISWRATTSVMAAANALVSQGPCNAAAKGMLLTALGPSKR
ncbi:Uncharacterised protein [Mycobacterium tuberculosis]|uniref:Uncharacterized protein n=1 Tax=Mycobacterium tuberculosis TaxID=1773 RepID=A0A0U0RUG9_MYCTX|nr:Uncharacterised protein [Mycobacterium tuberculosis]COW27562.1 Uncharacterised protein [Mycobacterium tuberculosis]COW36909.1 Uncharacterised protein [Mycobacterium tuberculosis]COY29388.1 Uncharacterised protein [Mycobacterium tuberculosis]COY58611.1 Uncharacterised protein [Mycobacterium tuberculosis]